MDPWLLLALLVLIGGAIIIYVRLLAEGRIEMPPLREFTAASKLSNLARSDAASQNRLHLSTGRASLTGADSQTSNVALGIADEISSSENIVLTTTGDGDLYVAAEEILSGDGVYVNKLQPDTSRVAFVAAGDDAFAYAAGAALEMQDANTQTNVMVGHFSSELAILADTARINNKQQIAGSDDPAALAVASATVDELMIGEELFTAPAYMNKKRDQLAAILTQDLLRWVAAAAIVGLAAYALIEQMSP